MRSMTGYGHCLSSEQSFDLEIEIRTLNNRYLDLVTNVSNDIGNYEHTIRELVGEKIKRGRVSLNIFIRNRKEPDLELDRMMLKKVYELYVEAGEVLELDSDVSIQDIMMYEGVIRKEVCKRADQETFEIVKQKLNNCLKSYLEMTYKEGKRVKSYLETSLLTMKNALSQVESHLPHYRKQLKDRFVEAIKEFVTEPFPEDIEKRVMVEVSLYIDRNDVNEEIVRLKDHYDKLEDMLQKDEGEVGKRMNFIFQELHREIQTLSAKVKIIDVLPHVLIIKEEIEKCRELIQNVE